MIECDDFVRRRRYGVREEFPLCFFFFTPAFFSLRVAFGEIGRDDEEGAFR